MDNTLNYNINFNSNSGKITAGVDHLDKALKNAGGTAMGMGKQFNMALESMNNKLSTIRLHSFINNIAHASQGLSALSAPGLKLSSELAELSSIAGVAGESLKEIEGYARESAKTFGGDAADGINSYKLLLSQLGPDIAQSPKALQAMGHSVNTLAKTMGGDTVGATETLTTALNQYNVSTEDPIKASEEMARMMNIMAAAAKEGSAELPQQKQALENAGMAAAAANVSFAETSSAIQVLDKAGLRGSAGGIALRNTLASLSQGRFLPKDIQEELKAAGVDINILGDKTLSFTDRLKPLKSIMHDSALVTKLFGRANGNAAIALIGGIEAQEELTEKIQDTNTAYEQAAIIMESPAEKAGRLKARIDDLKISFFNVTGGALGYVNVIGEMSRDVGYLIPVFVGFGKTLAFVTNAQKMQALWTKTVTVATSVWTGAQWLLNAALNANPIGLIVAAVAILGAAIYWLVTKVDGWGEAWSLAMDGAKLVFQGFVAGVKANFTLLVDGFMIGINKIQLAYYKFKEAMGLGDSAENQKMISQINDETEKRKKAITDGYETAANLGIDAAKKFGEAGGALSWKQKEEAEDGISDAKGSAGTFAQFDPNALPGGDTKKLATSSAIATGGTKHNYITINLKDLIGELNIKGNDFKDSAKQMQDQASDALLRTLALAVTAGN